MHAAKTWSDPHGSASIRVKDPDHLQKYRFGLKTADFYVCRTCGAYVGAVLSEGNKMWSTLNLRLSTLTLDAMPASYGDENAADRISRRRQAWTPTVVVPTAASATPAGA